MGFKESDGHHEIKCRDKTNRLLMRYYVLGTALQEYYKEDATRKFRIAPCPSQGGCLKQC